MRPKRRLAICWPSRRRSSGASLFATRGWFGFRRRLVRKRGSTVRSESADCERLVLGLGNPGRKYRFTRHNIGWRALDQCPPLMGLASFKRSAMAYAVSGRYEGCRIHLVKPRSWMNRSGEALARLSCARRIDLTKDLLVVADDFNLDLGRIRFRPKGGSGGHNGLKSIRDALGTKDFHRLRVGVGKRPPGLGMAEWALSPFTDDEEARLREILPELGSAIARWATSGIESAMDRFNR